MTPPKTKKLFISYRSSDAAKVDAIAHDLASLKHDDGTPRYITWQDKHNLPPASPNWWDAIVDAIIDCDMFVFHLSYESLRSEVCRAELDYAHRRNRPIIPIVLEGEFELNVKSGRYNIPEETFSLIPDWLRNHQMLFYNGASFFAEFAKAVGVFERNWPPDVYAGRPDNPNDKSVHGGNAKLYGDARDYAYKLAFADADRLFTTLLQRADATYKQVAAKWLEIIRRYADIIEIVEHHSPTSIFNQRWTEYLELFPNSAVEEGIFDPKNFAERDRIAREKVAADRIAREKTEADRIARESAEAYRIVREKAERDRIAAEKAEKDRIAREKAEADRLTFEDEESEQHNYLFANEEDE